MRVKNSSDNHGTVPGMSSNSTFQTSFSKKQTLHARDHPEYYES